MNGGWGDTEYYCLILLFNKSQNFKPAESQNGGGELLWMENKGNKRTELLDSSSPNSQLVRNFTHKPMAVTFYFKLVYFLRGVETGMALTFL